MIDQREFHGHLTADGGVVWDFPAQVKAYRRRLFATTDGQVTGQFYPMRSKRSDRQNRALWALLNAWCREADQGWRPDDLKDAVMAQVFGTIEVTNPITGEIGRALAKPHTSTLTVSEFCAVIEAILELAATSEPSVFLDAPDEFRKAKEKERKQAARGKPSQAA